MRSALCAILAFAPALASAQTADLSEVGTKEDRACAHAAYMAKTFMYFRQDSFPMTNVMKRFSDEPTLKAMILEAYSVPLAATTAGKDAAISEFANSWALRCYNGELPSAP